MLLTPININGGCHENNVMPLINAKYVITPIIENVIRRTATPAVIVERALVSFSRLFTLIESIKMDAQLVALDASKHKFGEYVWLLFFSFLRLSLSSILLCFFLCFSTRLSFHSDRPRAAPSYSYT